MSAISAAELPRRGHAAHRSVVLEHRAPASTRLPPWVRRLGFPAWVSDPEGLLVYINRRAEAFLGVRRGRSVGQPCHRVIGARGANGEPHCRGSCPVRRRAQGGLEIEPVRVYLPRVAAPDAWVQLLVIPLAGRDSRPAPILHAALAYEREHRIEEYVRRIASRSEALAKAAAPLAGCDLTPRERDILARLAADHNLREIAFDLGLSYVTVRNHVQHLLAKLGAHSIQEAVAKRLLGDGGGEP